jgi:hypothetical protein
MKGEPRDARAPEHSLLATCWSSAAPLQRLRPASQAAGAARCPQRAEVEPTALLAWVSARSHPGQLPVRARSGAPFVLPNSLNRGRPAKAPS